MSATVHISPYDLLNWPVLETDPVEGITIWLQFEEDFLGHRLPVKFPYMPSEFKMGLVYATNVPIIGVVAEKPPKRRKSWTCTGFSLWSEKEKGICLFPDCTWDDNTPISLWVDDRVKINEIRVVVS